MAKKTQNTQLYFLDPETKKVVNVGCVTSIDGLDASIDQIETTCLDASGRTYEAGMPTPSAATFGINTDPNDASHVRLHQLYKAGTSVEWAIGWSDGYDIPPTIASEGLDYPETRSWIAFDGYVSAFPFSFALNAVVASTVSIQVSGFPDWLPKTSTTGGN